MFWTSTFRGMDLLAAPIIAAAARGQAFSTAAERRIPAVTAQNSNPAKPLRQMLRGKVL